MNVLPFNSSYTSTNASSTRQAPMPFSAGALRGQLSNIPLTSNQTSLNQTALNQAALNQTALNRSPDVEQQNQGFEMFERLLGRAYAMLTRPASAQKLDDKGSAESTANTILGFIEQRLRKDQSAGASPEALAKRLEEGLRGFKQGFNEAREQVRAMGLLSQEVDDDIGKTFELVTAGIEDLRESFVTSIYDAPSKNVARPSHSVDAQGPAELSYAHSYASASRFRFEVETADGDVVTIHAQSQFNYDSAAHLQAQDAGGHAANAWVQWSQTSHFALSVEGELDSDELNAIGDLLDKVEQLSNDFFAGNVDAAFDQALKLGYNKSELVGYSLNLRQVEVERLHLAYRAFAPAQNINPLARQLEPLANFTRGLLDALDTATAFAEAADLLLDLSERFESGNWNEELGRGFSAMVKRLLPVLLEQQG